MLVKESIKFEKKRDPKKALELDPYLDAILKIPNSYTRSESNTLYNRFKNRTGYENWVVVKAEKEENGMIKVDVEHTYPNGTVSTNSNLLLTPGQFKKFRYIK